MKFASIISAGAAVLAILASSAWAQQTLTGTVTQIDRLNHTVAVRPAQSGTVGANTGGAAELLKAQDSVSLEALHAGDTVSFSIKEIGGTRVITEIKK